MEKIKILLNIFWIFFKIGLFTFGGGYAMMPIMEDEVVKKRHWMSEEEIADYFAVANSLPGIIAINTATFIGKKMMGLGGALMATLGVSLPAFLSILLLVTALQGAENNIYVQKFFLGIRAASTALIFMVAIKFARNFLKKKSDWLIAVSGFLAIALGHINAIWVVVTAGLIGYFLALNRRN